MSFAVLLAAGTGGCANLQCSPENCASDAKITEDVRGVFNQHPEFGPPGALRVQTINGVVYLSGQVNTDLVRRSAEELVKQVPNVKRVVNSLNASNAVSR